MEPCGTCRSYLALLLLEGACSTLCIRLCSVVTADHIATPAGKSEQLQNVYVIHTPAVQTVEECYTPL